MKHLPKMRAKFGYLIGSEVVGSEIYGNIHKGISPMLKPSTIMITDSIELECSEEPESEAMKALASGNKYETEIMKKTFDHEIEVLGLPQLHRDENGTISYGNSWSDFAIYVESKNSDGTTTYTRILTSTRYVTCKKCEIGVNSNLEHCPICGDSVEALVYETHEFNVKAAEITNTETMHAHRRLVAKKDAVYYRIFSEFRNFKVDG